MSGNSTSRNRRASPAFAVDDSVVLALDDTGVGDRNDALLVIAVVGAGPAGLAAATVAAEAGLRVALFDEQRQAGGQIHRGITASPLARPAVLGADYWAGGSLVRADEQEIAREHRKQAGRLWQ